MKKRGKSLDLWRAGDNRKGVAVGLWTFGGHATLERGATGVW